MPSKSSLLNVNLIKLTKKYQGRKIEELFPNHSILQNAMGTFMDIFWQFPDIHFNLDLTITKKNLLHNLKLIQHIGGITENYLISRDIQTIYDLTTHLKYQDSALKILNLIHDKKYQSLCKKKNIFDLDVLFCFEKEELLFLDIETLGLAFEPIIIVGIGFYKKQQFHIHALFARKLEEEIAICEHLRHQLLPHFKCFITYNGKSFDIPYLVNRFLYFFEENPMNTDKEIPYRTINTRFYHVDLYHNCRRKYKEKLNKFTLASIEHHVLNAKRKNDIDGSMVSMCYRKFLKDPYTYSGLIYKCIHHNFLDIFSMPLILQKLIQP